MRADRLNARRVFFVRPVRRVHAVYIHRFDDLLQDARRVRGGSKCGDDFRIGHFYLVCLRSLLPRDDECRGFPTVRRRPMAERLHTFKAEVFVRVITLALLLSSITIADDSLPAAYWQSPLIRENQYVLWHDPGTVETLDFRYGIGAEALAPKAALHLRGRGHQRHHSQDSSQGRQRADMVYQVRRRGEPRHLLFADGMGHGLLHRRRRTTSRTGRLPVSRRFSARVLTSIRTAASRADASSFAPRTRSSSRPLPGRGRTTRSSRPASSAVSRSS